MTRALTMVETLVALALLSALLMAVASWTQVTARATTAHEAPLRWRAGADAVLALIEDDLACGDFEKEKDRSRNPRVTAAAGSLSIRTRTSDSGSPPGPTTRVYRYERSERRLDVQQADAEVQNAVRPLLDAVADWQCVVNEKDGLVEVTIVAEDGATLTRRWSLP